MAGVSRAELQSRIAEGALTSFEGRIDVAELHRLYPELERGRAGMIAFVEQVKEDALHKGVRRSDRADTTPEQDRETAALRRERDHFKNENARLRALLSDVERTLEDLQSRVTPALPVRNLLQWLRGKRG